jgi:hypothetical protein
MPWPKGISGNPGGRPAEVLEVREVRRLAQAKTVRAFEIVAELMESAAKDSVRLAAALAVLKMSGVRMDGEMTVTVNQSPRNPYSDKPTAELLSSASTSAALPS